jgi:tetratricopeptide (TPR) repeat protein
MSKKLILGLLYVWSMVWMLPARGFSQVINIPLGGGIPQAKTRDELDAFGAIYDHAEPPMVVQAVSDFARRFPDSVFLEYADMAAMHAYGELGDRNASRTMAQSVLKFNPNNVDALLTLAQLTLDDSSIRPDKAAQWSQAGNYARQGIAELDRYTLPVLADRQRWLRTKRDFLGRGYCILGRLAFHQGDLDGAVSNLQKAININPLGDYFYYQGLAFEAKGQPEQARASLVQAMSLGPEPVRRSAAHEIENLGMERKSQR